MIIKSNNETIYSKILGAIIQMNSNPDDAIFAYTLMAVPIIIDVNNKISNTGHREPTDSLIYTDGRGIKIVGNIFEINAILSSYGVVNVLKHEIEHILLQHIARIKDFTSAFKDYKKEDIVEIFNIASDYIINKDLGIKDNKTFNFVTDSYMERFNLKPQDLEKKSAEEIALAIIKNNPPIKLSELIKEIKKMLNGDGFGGKSAFTHVVPYEMHDFDDFITKNAKRFDGNFDKYLADIIKTAVTTYGYGQSNVWKKLDGIYGKHIVDWEAVLTENLRQYKTNSIDENGIKIVNRRYYQISTYLNTPLLFNKVKRSFKDGVIAIDTSGSIDDEKYKKEISSVIDLVKKEGIDWEIILFDDGIVKDENGENIILHTKNFTFNDLVEKLLNRTYGGTNIKEVLDFCEKEKAKFLILISDMRFNYDLKEYNGFKKIFISTEPPSSTDENVKKICDVLAFFEQY
jgi:predicted metal-dependent peptidase